MTAARRFDWGEAARLRGAGVSVRRIAERFGVSRTAVYLATDAGLRARAAARHAAWQRAGSCPACGGQCSRNSSVSYLCRACATIEASYRRVDPRAVRPGVLRCLRCGAWKPDGEFARASGPGLARRGRRSECRACGTARRRVHRQARPDLEAASVARARQRRRGGLVG